MHQKYIELTNLDLDLILLCMYKVIEEHNIGDETVENLIKRTADKIEVISIISGYGEDWTDDLTK
jgi:hypothetical protein